MKKAIRMSVVAALMLLGAVNAQAQTAANEGIQFVHGTWAEAQAKAKAEGKPLFVDIWASWCGPCKRLGKEIFPQKEVGDYFNPRFVCYKLQTDPKDKALRHEADSIQKAYGVQSLPTLLWIAPDGKLMHFSTGYRNAKQLIATAEEAVDPQRNTSFVLSRWENGDHSMESGLAYFAVKAGDREGFDKFFASLNDEQKMSHEMIFHIFVCKFLPAESTTIQYIAGRMSDKTVPDSVSSLARMVLFRTLPSSFARCEDEAAEQRLEDMYSKYNLPQLRQWRDQGYCQRQIEKGDWKKCFDRLREIDARRDSTDITLNLTMIYLKSVFKDGKLTRADIPTEMKQWADHAASMMKKGDYRAPNLVLEVSAMLGLKAEAEKAYDELVKAMEASKGEIPASYASEILNDAKKEIEAMK